MATQIQCAKHLCMSERSFRDLVKSGAVKEIKRKNGYNLADVREQYIKHLREQAAGRNPEIDGKKLDEQKARRQMYLADKAEIELGLMKGDLIPAVEIEKEIVRMVTAMKTKMLAIPVRLAPKLGTEDTAKTEQKISEEIREALQDLASTEVVPKQA